MIDSLTEQYLAEIRRLALDYVSGYNVRLYLFGSRVAGTARKTSDVDIAILPLEPLPIGFLAGLSEVLAESTIPYTVDVIDLSQADIGFRKKVLSETKLWSD